MDFQVQTLHRWTDSTTQGMISCSKVGIGNGKVFAPLARCNSIRFFLTISIELDLEIYHMDTNNNFHNIVRFFDVLPNFSFTTSETRRDYYLQTWYIRVSSRVAEQGKT